MTTEQVIDIGTKALVVCAKVGGPFLLVVLAIGIIVGLLQSVTQLQEPTLTFVPKLVGIGAVLAVGGGWMLNELVEFTRHLYESIPGLLR